jgi:DNA-binding NarL/FixJ family response regulator
MRVHVLVVDDNPLLAEAVSALLETDARIAVVGCAENGAEAVDFARKLVPDVVLMDIRMPVMSGVEATERILDWLPEVKVLILTALGSEEEIEAAFAAGAVGCLTTDDLGSRLIETVLGVTEPRRREFAASFLGSELLFT